MTGLKLLAAAHATPEKIVTNFDFEKTLDTSNEWIITRTGISERHFSDKETNAELAISAAKKALIKANISHKDISLCIVATFTPDSQMPNTASAVAQSLSFSEDTICYDLNAACTGFVYALNSAAAFLSAESGKCALIIGSEIISKCLDMSERSTCVLFGDGAGAAIFEADKSSQFCFMGGCRPELSALYCNNNKKIQMEGQSVFRFAAEIVPKCITELLNKSGLTLNDINKIVCHQANKRIIEAAARRLGADIDKFFINLQSYGNTSAASIPIALSELAPIKGSKIICVGFGAGLSYGAALINV